MSMRYVSILKTPEHRWVFEYIASHPGCTASEIREASGLPANRVQSIITRLNGLLITPGHRTPRGARTWEVLR